MAVLLCPDGVWVRRDAAKSGTVRMQGGMRGGEVVRVCDVATHPLAVEGKKKSPREGGVR